MVLLLELLCTAVINVRNMLHLNKSQRSCCDTLHTETGRYKGVPEDDKICKYCNLNEMKNEIHLIL